jgi:hypothetical protein
LNQLPKAGILCFTSFDKSPEKGLDTEGIILILVKVSVISSWQNANRREIKLAGY